MIRSIEVVGRLEVTKIERKLNKDLEVIKRLKAFNIDYLQENTV